MKPARTSTSIALAIAAAAGISLPVAAPARANPNGAEVVHGQATMGTNVAGQLEIRNSDGTIINWREFSIGEGEATRFVQPSAQSAVLNRVLGRIPSEILGQLSSNGRVFLINPNGMVFGPGAKIDTAGFVASTLDITDADFLAGRLQFEGTGGRIDNASIQNYGMIQAGPGGEIVLIAPQVKNEGVLSVVGGQLILAAGQKVRLSSLNIDDVTIEVSAPGNQALNLGRLIAERGAVGMLGASVINRGRIEANSISRDAQGRIVLSASDSLELGTGSVLDASGVLGGDIRLSANDTALVRGSLAATGSDGLGGRIDISGASTGVFGDVRIDASGATGGGNVRIGGGYQGRDADIANATHTVVNAGARISADALGGGDGGTVTVWADGSTRFGGAISARGGAAGGNGGSVEVSGHALLGFDGRVDVGAVAGSSGQILLDPNNLTITASTTTNNGELGDGAILFGDGGATDFTVSEAALEALTGNIDLQAQQNLTVATGTTLNLVNQGNGELVSFRAGGNLTVNGSIITNGADLLLSASDAGATTPNAAAVLAIASGIVNVTNGGGLGDVTLRNRGSGGIALTNSTLTLGAGTLAFDTAGALAIAGSTINGGTLSALGTSRTLAATGNNTFSNVTLDMDFTLPGGRDLDLGTAFSITAGNTLRMQGNAANARLLTTTNGMTIGGVGTLSFEGTTSNNQIFSRFGGVGYTFGSGLTIGGASSTRGAAISASGTLTNNATIDAAASGQTISISGVTNQAGGVLRANGGNLTIAGTSSNPGGTLSVQGGNLNFDGVFTSFGTFTRGSVAGGTANAGAVNITGNGNLNFGNTTFVFNDTTGVFNLAGGSITNATLDRTGVGDLLLTGNSGFTNVTLDMDFIVPGGRDLDLVSAFTVTAGNTLRLQGNAANARLLINTNGMNLGGAGTIAFEGSTSNNQVFSRFGGVVYTLGSGLTIGGASSTRGAAISASGTLTNNATIDAAASGQTISISGVTNQAGGVLRASGGNLTIAGTSSNPGGTLSVQGGNLNFDGTFTNFGTFTRGSVAGGTANAGAVNITGNGNLNFGNTTFVFNDTTGVFNLAGGSITNATLSNTGVGDLLLTGNSGFTNVTLDMDFIVPGGRDLDLATAFTITAGNTLRMQGNAANARLLTTTNGMTIGGNGTIAFEGTTSNNQLIARFGGVGYTLGSGLTIGGATSTCGGAISASGTLTNNATIDAAASGQTISISGVTNQAGGVLRANGGNLTIAGTSSNPGGTLSVQGGNLNFDGTFTNFGTFTRGSVGGGTANAGAVNITGSGNLNFGNTNFVFNDTTGVFNLAGGTISNATLDKAGVGDLLLTGNSTLNNVTLDMDFIVPGGRDLDLGTAFSITAGNTLRLQGNAANARLLATTNGMTIGGAGAISFEGTTSNNQLIARFGGVGYALGSGLTIGGASSTRGGSISAAGPLTNNATIDAVASGQTIAISGVTNQAGGVLRANGGNLTLSGTWSNPAGLIDLQAGALTLDGAFSSLGMFNRAGVAGGLANAGTVTMPGDWNLLGTTFVFDDTKGVFVLNGGAIRNGTLQQGGAGNLVMAGTTTFTDIVLDMDFIVPSGRVLFTGNTLTVAATRTLRLDSSPTGGARIAPNTTNATIAGPGTIAFEGTSDNGGIFPTFGGQTTTLGPTLQLGGSRGALISASTLNVQNSILADDSGRTLTLNATALNLTGTLGAATSGNLTISGLVNRGALNVDGGGTVTLNGNWSNPTGTINVIDGVLNLDGTFSDFGTFTRTSVSGGTSNAGAVNVTGVWNLGGSPFTFDDVTGVFNINGGTINNGTLRASGVGDLLMTGTSTFNSITLDMDFIVPSSRVLFAGTTLTVAAGRTLRLDSSPSGGARIAPSTISTTLSGPGSILFEGTSDNGGIFPTFGGQTTTLDASLQLGGSRGAFISATTLNNQTSIVANDSGRTLTVNAATLNNTGTLRATAGGLLVISGLNNQAMVQVDDLSTITLNSNWTNNTGTLRVTGGTLNLDGTFVPTGLGTFDRDDVAGGTSNAGTVNLTGTLTLGGGAFTFDDVTGVFNINAGTINNGTLRKTGVGDLLMTGTSTFNSVTLDMDYIVPAGRVLFAGTTLTVASGRALRLDSGPSGGARIAPSTTSTTFLGPGSILFEGTADNGGIFPTFGGQTTTLDASLQLGGSRGAFISATTLNNQTSIVANDSGRTLTVNATTLNNTGTLRATTGGLLVISGLNNQALVQVDDLSTVTLNGNWTNNTGTLRVTGGTLNLDGTFVPTGLGTFDRDDVAGGTSNAGTVNLTGILNLGGGAFTFDDVTGVFNINVGTINSGTLRKSGVGELLMTGTSTFNSVTLDMDFIVPASRVLFAGTTLTVAAGRSLRLDSSPTGSARIAPSTTSATLFGPGSILFEGTADNGGIFPTFGGQTTTLDASLQLGGSRGAFISATTLNTQGRINVAAGRTVTLNGSTTMNNTGTVALGDGATLSLGGLTLLNNGTIDLGTAGTLTASNINLTNNGTLSGNGRIDLTTDATREDLINNGTLRPGNSPGIITLDGDLVLNSTSVLDLEVQGRARGRQYDAFDVTGTVTLGGTLDVTHLAPYAGIAGDSFRVITSGGARTGAFAGISTPVAYNTQVSDRTGNNNLLLQVGATAQPINFWLNDANGNFGDGVQWSLGSAPVAGQIAIIDRTAADITATANSAQSSGILFVTNTLALTTGTFTVTDASLIDLDGTLNLTGAVLAGSALLGVDGRASFSDGSITGRLGISGTGTLDIFGSAAKTISGGSIDNGGTFLLRDAGNVNTGNGTVINNLAGGVLQLGGDNALRFNLGGTATVLNNFGTLVRNAASGTGTATIDTTFNNGGSVDIVAGRLVLAGPGVDSGSFSLAGSTELELSGGTRSINGGATGDGSLLVSGANASVGGAATYDVGSTRVTAGTLSLLGTAQTRSLRLEGGTLTGSGQLSVSTAASWSDGTLSLARVQVPADVTFDINGANAKALLGTTIDNAGTLLLRDAGNVNSGQGAVINNLAGGLLQMTGNASLLYNAGGATSVLNNLGTLERDPQSGAGIATLGLAFQNSGAVNLLGGRLVIDGDGTDAGAYILQPGTTLDLTGGSRSLTGALSGDGSVRIAGATLDVSGAGYDIGNTIVDGGSLRVNGTATTRYLSLIGGTLGGTGRLTLSGSPPLPGFASTWTDGTLELAELIIGSSAALTILGSNAKSLLGGRIDNAGSVTLIGPGPLNTGAGATINNLEFASFVLDTGAIINYNLGGGATSFVNAGFLGTAAFGSGVFNGIGFTNTAGGIVSVSSLTLTGPATNAGSMFLDSSGVLEVPDGFTSTGSIAGSGTIRVGSTGGGTLINSGSINPSADESSTGELAIEGSLQFTGTGVYNADFRAPDRFDRIMATQGVEILAGASLVVSLGSFEPTAGDSASILEARSITGSFTSMLPGGLEQRLFTDTGGSRLVLRIPSVVGCRGSICFDNDAGDSLWTNPINWTGDVLPGAADDVRIELAEPVFVLLDSGEFAITSLFVAFGNGLRIDGGALTIATSAIFDGTFDFLGGFLGGDGSIAFNDRFTWAGGTLGGNPGSEIDRGADSSITFTGSGARTLVGRALRVDALSFAGVLTLQSAALASDGAVQIADNSNLVLQASMLTVGNGADIDLAQFASIELAGTSAIQGSSTGAAGRLLGGGLVFAGPGTEALIDGLDVVLDANGSLQVGGRLEITRDLTSSGAMGVGFGATLAVGGSVINSLGGQILSGGTIDIGDGMGTLANAGLLAPTIPEGDVGIARVRGSVVLAATSLLDMDVAGIGNADLLQVTGALTIADGARLRTNLRGTFTPPAGSSFTLVTASSISGSFAFTPPEGLSLDAGATAIRLLGPAAFECAGTICFDNDAGDSLWSNPRNWTSDVLPGATDDVRIDLGGPTVVVLDSGSFSITNLLVTFGNGLRISGGMLSISGSAVFDGTFELLSGLLGGTGTLRFNRGLAWQGGTLSGNAGSRLDFGEESEITFSGSGNRELVGRAARVDNFTLAAGSLDLQAGAVLDSDGSIEIGNGATLQQDGGTLMANGTLSNAGVLRVRSGRLVLQASGTHTGTFDAASGATLNFSGDQAFADGSRLQGGGAFVWDESAISLPGTGTGLTIAGAGTRLDIVDASVGGDGNLNATTGTRVVLDASDILTQGTLALGGDFDWRSGSIGGGGTLRTTGATTLSSGNTKSLTGLTWENSGILVWTAGALSIDSASLLRNGSGGVFRVEFAEGPANIGGSGVLDNASGGTFVVATAQSCVVATAFTNTGLVTLDGRLTLLQDFSNQGTVRLGASGSLGTDDELGDYDAFGNGSNGRIEGRGTIDVRGTGLAFSNNGVLAPGSSPGLLTIQGDFVQGASGVLEIELGGSSSGSIAGTDYDQLLVTGSAGLGGTLRLATIDGAALQPGSTFDVLRYASATGAFATTVQPAQANLLATTGLDAYTLQLAGNADPLLAPERGVLVFDAPQDLAQTIDVLQPGTDNPVQFIPRRRGGACN